MPFPAHRSRSRPPASARGRSGWVAVAGWIGLGACAGPDAPTVAPSAPASVPCASELDCAAEALLAQLPTDPDAAVAMVQARTAPEAQWILVSRAVESMPEHARVLCDALGDPGLRDRCITDTSRPHLYAKPPERNSQPGHRSAPGPHSSTLVLQLSAPSRFAQLDPVTPSCGEGRSTADCAREAARWLAQQGQAVEAAATCRSISSDRRWRGECAFQAAEASVQVLPPNRADEAIELCLLAEDWVGRCVDKVHEQLARTAPAASAPAEAWRPVLVAWHVMALTWARQPQEIQQRVQDAYWAAVVAHAYRQVREPTGDPLDTLPEPAHPHVRAAAAVALLRGAPDGEPVMATLVASLETALSGRRAPDAPPTSAVLFDTKLHDHWATDGPRDDLLPAIHYLGVSRRVFAEDPAVDLQICLLEAAARSDPAWHGLIDASWADPDPLIGPTARRLAHALGRPEATRQGPTTR